MTSVLNKFRLDDRTALVTGAATGVALAEAGARVACHGNTRSPDETCGHIRTAGGEAYSVTGDLSKSETARHLVEQTLDHVGRIDILVNNAGTIRRAPAVEYSEEDWTAVLEVNLNSVFRLCQLAGKHMIESKRGRSE